MEEKGGVLGREDGLEELLEAPETDPVSDPLEPEETTCAKVFLLK